LDLKKQLAASQTKAAETKQEKPAAAPVVSSLAGAAELEKEVVTQGEAVRKLKSAKADKKDIDAAVVKLLDLKKQLAAVTGHEPAAAAAQTSKKKGGNKKLIH
jgi:microcompartment protein CcmK/EutM